MLIKKRTFIFLCLILMFSAFLRLPSFWIPHWGGDQTQYISLALKLKTTGLAGYNFYKIKFTEQALKNNDNLRSIETSLYPENVKGDLIRDLKLSGFGYYDVPFFYKPPLFAYTLMLSNYIFSSLPENNKQVLAVMPNYTKNKALMKNPSTKTVPEIQFWSAIIPFTFSLGLVLLTFLLGSYVFSDKVGLLSALILSTSAVDILCSQKIWPEETLAFFCLLSVYWFFVGLKRERNLYFLLSGISCALAILTKQTALILYIALLGCLVLKYINTKKNILIQPPFWLFFIGVFSLSFFWFYKIYITYGNWLYHPIYNAPIDTSLRWNAVLNKRPYGLVLFFIGTLFICPLINVCFLKIKTFFKDLWSFIVGRKIDPSSIFLWVIILCFLIAFPYNKEHRRWLQIYPLLAILSASLLINSKFLNTHKNLLYIIVSFSCIWSSYIGFETVQQLCNLILFPF
ncbi:MAG: glycosyltransferase family 39 protein [Candidatus Omnitrophica bacterium]|nr:glycosyltransferase family 39 protein [Candidatus Omnitrophota bacterium]